MKVGGVYKINSRNLRVGVYLRSDPKDPNFMWFIGIRTKFGNRYLSSEWGWNPEYIGMVGKNIELIEGKSDGKYFRMNRPLFRSLAQFEGKVKRNAGL